MADFADFNFSLLLGSFQESGSAYEVVNERKDLSDMDPSSHIRFELAVRRPSSFEHVVDCF